jgi:hypothetical protein
VSQTPGFQPSLCGRELPPEGLRLDVIRADALAVDLDHGNQLSISGLQLGIPVDRDLGDAETQLGTQAGQLPLRALTEVTARCRVDDDRGTTDRAPA